MHSSNLVICVYYLYLANTTLYIYTYYSYYYDYYHLMRMFIDRVVTVFRVIVHSMCFHVRANRVLLRYIFWAHRVFTCFQSHLARLRPDFPNLTTSCCPYENPSKSIRFGWFWSLRSPDWIRAQFGAPRSPRSTTSCLLCVSLCVCVFPMNSPFRACLFCCACITSLLHRCCPPNTRTFKKQTHTHNTKSRRITSLWFVSIN